MSLVIGKPGINHFIDFVKYFSVNEIYYNLTTISFDIINTRRTIGSQIVDQFTQLFLGNTLDFIRKEQFLFVSELQSQLIFIG